MSTRANIVIKDKYDKLFFYRHSDGYPSGVEETLTKLMSFLQTGKLRNNASQFAGWLILLGAIEYGAIPAFTKNESGYGDMDTVEVPKDWKVGAYEPTTGIHGDIQYLYVIDLDSKTCLGYEDWTDKGEGKGTPIADFSATQSKASGQ